MEYWKFLSGVNLWNISGLIGKYPENDGYEHTAARKLNDPVVNYIHLSMVRNFS